MISRIWSPVVAALAKRDLARYFNNPTGYVFITLFIFLSGVAAFWQPRFFLRNLATLDQLNAVFPYLLILFAAALTMGTWADERKQGTDELLLTLPASDREIVLGKYAAVLGIYSVSLLISLSHVVVLARLGNPDPGLLAANYLGYWLVGAAVIPIGMVASALTSNGTVAFVLAAVLCAAPVLIDAAARLFDQSSGRFLAQAGVFVHFDEFAQGVVSVSAVLYFTGLAALFLGLNILVIGRQRATKWTTRLPRAVHMALRVAACVVALAAATVLASRANVRLDATAERVHSLGDETRRLITTLPDDRMVRIQAFVSPDVPEEYVQQRESLLATLRDVDALARGRAQVVVTETTPYSDNARLARERFGILPRLVANADAAVTGDDPVFLAVTFTSGADEQVIPFLEHGLSPEYEVTRALRLVTRTTRKRVGVIDTDAGMLGGVDAATGSFRLPWAIVRELRRQYEVVEIDPSSAIADPVDALIVVLPSRLLQRQMDNVVAAINGGIPAVVLVDPLPAMDLALAPAAPMAERANPYADPRQAFMRKNTGDVQDFMAALGFLWSPTQIAWDTYSPHPEFGDLPNEVVFVGSGSGSPEPFNPDHPATSGLGEVMLFYSGHVGAADGAGVSFTPLLQTGAGSGASGYFQVVQPTPTGPVLNTNPPRNPDGQPRILAAETRFAGDSSRKPFRVIAIADLDFISDQAFEMRAQAPANVSVDNISFFLNAVDLLAGDPSFIELRKTRAKYRTLERVAAQTRTFLTRRAEEEEKAAADAQAALDAAQARLKSAVESIAGRRDLDPLAKQTLARTTEAVERRKLEVLRTNIEQDKAMKVQASREAMESEIRRIQNTIRMTAVAIPPVPVICLGIVIFVRRRREERDAAALARRRTGDA
jgi:ABC-2 type transport system permease protein